MFYVHTLAIVGLIFTLGIIFLKSIPFITDTIFWIEQSQTSYLTNGQFNHLVVCLNVVC